MTNPSSYIDANLVVKSHYNQSKKCTDLQVRSRAGEQIATVLKHREAGQRGIPLREGPIGGYGDLGLLAGDGDGIAKAAGLAAGDLDALLQELLERGDLHDLVLHRLGAVDREGDRPLLLARGRATLRHRHAARHLPSPFLGLVLE